MASLGVRGNHRFFSSGKYYSEENQFLNRPRWGRFNQIGRISRWRTLALSSNRIINGKTIGLARHLEEPYLLRKKMSNGHRNDRAVSSSSDKLDGWMRDSVAEIVKNLRDVPLFVHIYTKKNSDAGTTLLKTERAISEEDWPLIKGKWEKGEATAPEGIILVEELKDKKGLKKQGGEDRETSTKAWGVVVQGKGGDCGPACYLLKTCKVRSGLGVACTHFCLMRVKSFRETAHSQLTNCWLAQGQ